MKFYKRYRIQLYRCNSSKITITVIVTVVSCRWSNQVDKFESISSGHDCLYSYVYLYRHSALIYLAHLVKLRSKVQIFIIKFLSVEFDSEEKITTASPGAKPWGCDCPAGPAGPPGPPGVQGPQGL